MALSEILSKLKSERAGEEKQCKFCSVSGIEGDDALRAEYYRRVIERYAQVISFGEDKSIPELKRMVAPNESVKLKAESILTDSDLKPGQVEEFASVALDFVKSMPLLHSRLSVPFWLSPSEVMELGAGDAMDKAVLLCSLLLAVGAEASLRVVELEGELKHSLIVLHCKDCLVLDPVEGIVLKGKSADTVLPSYSFSGKRFVKALYEFNASDYEAFQ